MQPNQLIDKLSAIRTKVKMLAVAMGGTIVVTTAMACLVVAVLADYLLDLPAGVRIVLLLAAVGAIGYTIVRYMARPAMAKLTVGDIAGRVETAFPQFDDRLRSTVNFMADPIPGSDMMKEKVAAETARMADTVDLSQVVVAKPLFKSGGLAFGAVVAVVALSMLIPTYSQIGLKRLFSPMANNPWPKTVQIALQGNTPTRVTAGQRFYVKAKLTKGDKASRKAKLIYQYPGQRPVEELMTRNADGEYSAFHDAKLAEGVASGSVKVWIEAGDGTIEPLTVNIVPKLAIARVEADITPPAYADRRMSTVNLRESPAVMAAGSQVVMRVGFNKPLSAKGIELEPVKSEVKLPAVNITRDGDRTALIRFSPRESAEFRVKATDIDEFTNELNESYTFTIRPDQNPTVLIESPRGNEQRTPVASVPLQAVAEDDYGIKDVTLNVERLGDHQKWTIPLVAKSSVQDMVSWVKVDGSGDLQRHRLNWSWELSKMAPSLQPGDVLEYYLSVNDNFELDGQTHPAVNSGKLRLTIISQEELANIAKEEMQKAARTVLEIRRSQERTKVETQQKQQETENKDQLNDAEKNSLDQLANKQSTAASQTNQVANKMQELIQRMEENKSTATELKDTAKDVANSLKKTAEGPQKDATNKLNEAKDNPTPKEQRNDNLKDAVSKQDEASKNLDKALDKLGRSGQIEDMIKTVQDILKDQEQVSKDTAEIGRNNLGKQPKDMKPEDRDKLNKNADAQKNLAERTQKALNEMNEASKQMSKSDPSLSEAMKDAAKTGEQQQVSASQSKASQAASKNQQSQAQASQKQAELGLQMVLSALREAERRKLEEINEQLAKIKEQIENQIRRQAGHNLDNLAIQGPEKTAKIEAKTFEELLVHAKRDKARPQQPPTVIQLSAAQELTERNTRSIASIAEDIEKGGAEIAAHLTTASGKMQDAIVWLRQSKMGEAYDPPQVLALYSLLKAMTTLDDAQKEVEKKLDDKKKETIRAALVKVREAQDKLNKTTIEIDKAPRNADGSYKRDDQLKLNGLPGEQGKLAEGTEQDPGMKKISEDLQSLGGIVYIWAAKEVIGGMNNSKDMLAKPQTGAIVQIEQAKVVEQLDAMIESLKQEPKKDEGFQPPSGGPPPSGGGSPPPTLPTEAELRLLKALQVTVNNATVKLAAQPEKELMQATATRQGDLRELLGQLVDKATRGQIKIGPEPDSKQQLGNDATANDIEQQELADENAVGKPPAEKGGDLIRAGNRMGRSRQQLAIANNPGKVTQEIQKRIVLDLDKLIDQARQQQQSGSPQQGKGEGEKMAQGDAKGSPQNGQGQQPGKPGNTPNPNGSSPAGDSNLSGGGDTTDKTGKDIKETMRGWGETTPRERDAILEAQSETVIGKYKKYLDDYYKAQATRTASEVK